MGALSTVQYQNVMEEINATDDATTLGHCLHHLLQEVTDHHSNKIALICADVGVTYEELNNLANRFARILVERGIERGDLVCIALNRSIQLVVILLAVLKAGAAYVPIDPSFPEDRIGHMVDAAEPKLIIVEDCTKTATCETICPARAWRQSTSKWMCDPMISHT